MVTWQEYTREKPARRGWTLGAMIVLFVGTLATAWAVTISHASGPPLKPQEVPGGWPISFAVPETCERFEIGGVPSHSDSATPSEGYLGFVIEEASGARSLLFVMFNRSAGDAGLSDVASLFTDDEIAPGEPIALGPLAGQWMQQDPRQGLLAVAKSETGLAVAVRYVSNRVSSRDVEVFERVCASIKLVE